MPGQIVRAVSPDIGSDRLLAIILTIQPMVARTCILAAIEACIGNALQNKVPNLAPRVLIKFYPRELANLIIASIRMSRWFPESGLYRQLNEFQSCVSKAKNKTLAFATAGFPSYEEDSALVSELAAEWRACCAEGRQLLTMLHEELIGYAITTHAEDERDLRVLLDCVITGGHPLVEQDGTVCMPVWAERRKSQRVAVRMKGILTSSQLQQHVVIRDISCGGLAVELSAPLESGERVIVRGSMSQLFTGVVVSSDRGRGSIKFTHPLQGDDPFLKFCSTPGLPN